YASPQLWSCTTTHFYTTSTCFSPCAPTTELYTLSLHDALPIYAGGRLYFFDELGNGVVVTPGRDYAVEAKNRLAEGCMASPVAVDRKSTRLNSSHQIISYAVFCLKKQTQNINLLAD